MGFHIINQGYIDRAVSGDGFSVEEPPVLLYDSNENLGGVEYAGPSELVSESPNLLSDTSDDPTERWTEHKAASHVFSAPPYDEQTPLDGVTIDQWLTQENWVELFPPDESLEVGDTITTTWPGHDEPEERVMDLAEIHPDLRTLHIWTHVENPDGLFAATNPEFAQELEDGQHTHD